MSTSSVFESSKVALLSVTDIYREKSIAVGVSTKGTKWSKDGRTKSKEETHTVERGKKMDTRGEERLQNTEDGEGVSRRRGTQERHAEEKRGCRYRRRREGVSRRQSI